MQYQVYEEKTGDLIAWLDTTKEGQIVKDGFGIKAGKHLTAMESEERENRKLQQQIDALKAENAELKYILNDMKEVADAANKNFMHEQFRTCGCVVIEGTSKSAAYQDMVGILLHEGYEVSLLPVQMGKKLKITIKESEGNENE